MKQSKLLVCLGTLALAVASAAPSGCHRVTLHEPSVINGTELKPGDYRVEVSGNRATIKGDRQMVETSVKVEDAPTKIPYTTVRYNTGDGKYRLAEIRLGGTKTTLIFAEAGDTSAAGN